MSPQKLQLMTTLTIKTNALTIKTKANNLDNLFIVFQLKAVWYGQQFLPSLSNSATGKPLEVRNEM